MTRKPKLLVVEDRDNERRALARLLRMEGYDALTAKDADEALGRIAESVDLVITDLKMPEASGVELLQRWKARRPATPFILVTAYAEVDSAVSAMKLGAKDYLTKPIKPEEFLDLVARVVAESADTPPAADQAGQSAEPALGELRGGLVPSLEISGSSERSAPTDGPALPGGEPSAHQRLAAEAIRLEDLEKDAVLRALEREGGNRTHAARLLGISIRTLQRKLKAWGVTGRDPDAGDDKGECDRPNPSVP
ncbi:MAG TPA: response regulator [Pirellulales bacterium]|nr:response regulator [Pirellulales bacterium]